jgi:OOP family OmpA-OmpF porin
MSDSYPKNQAADPDQGATDGQSGLDELRSLIVGTTDRRVDRIQHRLDNPDRRAEDVSRVLPRAVSMSASRDGKLATALLPVTERAIRASIKKDRQIFVDLLFPVMGPAIRKAIAATIQGLIQNFNQMLEHSFSIKGLGWRLEAFRTRRPFAEVVLLHTLVYQVEQAFLVHRETGLLIEHVVAKTAVAQNPDLVSGMLTAIKDFVQDSFGAAQEDTLDTFQVGRRKVWIEHGPYAFLAIVISGNPSVHLKETMGDAIDEIHVNHSEILKAFDGNTEAFTTARPVLNGLLQVQFKSHGDKRSYGAWIVIGLVLLLFGWGLFHWIAQQSRWSRFVDKLHAQPGIVLTQITKHDGKHHLYGLRDPFAPASSQMIQGTQIRPESVVFHWEPYQSAFPEYVRQRSIKLLAPPFSVNVEFEGGTLRASGVALNHWIEEARRMARLMPWIDRYDDSAVIDIDQRLKKPETVFLTLSKQTLSASGSAPWQWIAKTRQAVKLLPGITGYNDEQLVDLDQQTWESLSRTIEETVFYFESGRNTLVSGQKIKLKEFVTAVRQWSVLSHLLNHPSRIDIIGHADQTGEAAGNLAISRFRAQRLAKHLVDANIDKTFFTIRAEGSRSPVIGDVDDAAQRALNRRVVFKVRTVEP